MNKVDEPPYPPQYEEEWEGYMAKILDVYQDPVYPSVFQLVQLMAYVMPADAKGEVMAAVASRLYNYFLAGLQYIDVGAQDGTFEDFAAGRGGIPDKTYDPRGHKEQMAFLKKEFENAPDWMKERWVAGPREGNIKTVNDFLAVMFGENDQLNALLAANGSSLVLPVPDQVNSTTPGGSWRHHPMFAMTDVAPDQLKIWWMSRARELGASDSELEAAEQAYVDALVRPNFRAVPSSEAEYEAGREVQQKYFAAREVLREIEERHGIYRVPME